MTTTINRVIRTMINSNNNNSFHKYSRNNYNNDNSRNDNTTNNDDSIYINIYIYMCTYIL